MYKDHCQECWAANPTDTVDTSAAVWVKGNMTVLQ